MSGYFDVLAERLRAAGVPADRVEATVADLRAYLADSGTAPEEEFGPAAEFAGRLAAGGEAAAAGPGGGERWVWTADVFVDRRRLNEFGEQGWEVEEIDHLGRFVCRRAPERPQRWEYRREVVTVGERGRLAERLAPDGWEPCGTWFCYAYFKRPVAALVGPAAELDAPPPRPAGSVFFSRRFYLLLGGYLLALVPLGLAVRRLLAAPSAGDGLETVAGMVTGMVTTLALVAAVAFVAARRRRRRDG